jgi:hypothetical protein
VGESENRVLRRIPELKGDEGTGGWRKLHNEKLRDLCSSSSVNRMIKSMRMMWARHVARMGEEECIVDFGVKTKEIKAARKT